MEVTSGRFIEVRALGPDFSNQLWSIVWLAMICPNARLILGGRRWIIAGKKPNMLEKWWGVSRGVGLNCLLVRDASSRAVSSPRMVTARAASLRSGGMLITGVFKGIIEEVIIKPAIMLPQASRLIGFRTAGLFSLMGESDEKRGCPMDTK